MKLIPIEILFPSITLSNDVGEVIKNDFLLSIMLGDPTIITLQSGNVVFSPSSIDVPMEVFGVGIALAEVANLGGLMFAGSFQNSETFNPTFQVSTEPSFFLGERAGLLSNIQLQNDIQGHEELQTAIREEAFAPRFEPMRRGLELVIETWTG